MADGFLDTLKALGVKAQETLGTTADQLIQVAGDVTVSAAKQAIQNAGKSSTAANGTIKQPTKGTDADGSTVLVTPSGKTSLAGSAPAWVWYVGGGALVLLSVVVVVKAVK